MVVLAENHDLVTNVEEVLVAENGARVADLEVATEVGAGVLGNFSKQAVAHATSHVRFPFAQVVINPYFVVRVST